MHFKQIIFLLVELYRHLCLCHSVLNSVYPEAVKIIIVWKWTFGFTVEGSYEGHMCGGIFGQSSAAKQNVGRHHKILSFPLGSLFNSVNVSHQHFGQLRKVVSVILTYFKMLVRWCSVT